MKVAPPVPWYYLSTNQVAAHTNSSQFPCILLFLSVIQELKAPAGLAMARE